MGLDFPVCIPSAVLRVKVRCVVPLWCIQCFPWRVQLGEVRGPYLTCPIRTATPWSPAGIFVQWSGGYRSEDNDADDGFSNPLLCSVNEYELKPDFFCIHLLSPCTSSANRLLSLSCNRRIMFWCELQNFVPRRFSVSACFWFLVCGLQGHLLWHLAKVGPMFSCNNGPRSNEQLSRLSFYIATVGWKRGYQPFSCRCSQNARHCREEICSTCLFKESIPAKFPVFFFAKTFNSWRDQRVGKGELLS